VTLLPTSAPERTALHNEVHARPSARIELPALTVLVAVFNEGISREQEYEHLRQLVPSLKPQDVQGNFARFDLGNYSLKWERHTEFTRYSFVQPFAHASDTPISNWLDHLNVAPDWLTEIPGQTFAAV
jgi:uncharacterized membrane-anchored protein